MAIEEEHLLKPGSSVKLLEITVETDGEAAEAVSAVFNEYGHGGAVIEEVWSDAASAHVIRVKTFLPAECSDSLSRIEEALWHLGQIYPIPLPPSVRWLSETDWAEAWKSGYSVQHIGRCLVIKPSWLTYAATRGQVVIELDPGLAFGTGLHPSTRLCLAALEDYLQYGAQVLDVGTGSGILSIAAAKLGAGGVIALDIDDTALEVARENIVRNGVQDLILLRRASLGPLTEPRGEDDPVEIFNASGAWDGTFDLLLMNILPDVIARSAEAIAACLAKGGTFIVSGIIQSQEKLVREALTAAGLMIKECRVLENWIALIGHSSVDNTIPLLHSR